MRSRCGEFVAFERLAKGILRLVFAILESGSWGDGGTNTAAAIHKDRAGVWATRGGVEGGPLGGVEVWQGEIVNATRGVDQSPIAANSCT